MTRTITLRKIGNSIGATFPKDILEKHDLAEGSTLHIIDTPDGISLARFDPDFEEAMSVFREGADSYKNALRELSK